ncbi:unnamed protein product [Alopecurus aequalis]
MALLPANLAVRATTLLLLLLLLAASASASSAANFSCTEPRTCQSIIAYTVPNATTYEELISRFNTSALEELLYANNLSLHTAPKEAIPAKTTIRIPFRCRCTGNGVGKSDGKPIVHVQEPDNLYNIVRYKFGHFMTEEEVGTANNLTNVTHILTGSYLWIPLPCSCDKVDGSDVMHLAYVVVGGGENTFDIATKYGVAESTLLRVNNITGGNLPAELILDIPLQIQKVIPVPGHINAALIVGGAVAILSVVVLVWFILSRSRWRRAHDSISSGTNGVMRYGYSNLARATKGFSRESLIGEGAFGVVYKGALTDRNGQQEVAVKKIKETRGEARDFHNELQTISKTSHKNLVRLEGWCASITWNLVDFMCWRRPQNVELFLVYEFIPNGNLEYHLSASVLTWEQRYKIVQGVGSALRYLHDDLSVPILHRDIKPGNILLDNDFTAKIADFGLSRVASPENTTLQTTAIGTKGYMDPQLIKHGTVEYNRKSDVYSFGIVLLEIACGKSTREQVSERYTTGRVVDAADEKLKGDFDTTRMARLIDIGLRCSHPDGKQRPYIEDAMKFLEDGIELPAITEKEGE